MLVSKAEASHLGEDSINRPNLSAGSFNNATAL
jgi:hypothetical protein